jgi:hypothetical protein
MAAYKHSDYKTLPELKQMCKDAELKGYSSLNKELLIDFMIDNGFKAKHLKKDEAPAAAKTSSKATSSSKAKSKSKPADSDSEEAVPPVKVKKSSSQVKKVLVKQESSDDDDSDDDSMTSSKSRNSKPNKAQVDLSKVPTDELYHELNRRMVELKIKTK